MCLAPLMWMVKTACDEHETLHSSQNSQLTRLACGPLTMTELLALAACVFLECFWPAMWAWYVCTAFTSHQSCICEYCFNISLYRRPSEEESVNDKCCNSDDLDCPSVRPSRGNKKRPTITRFSPNVSPKTPISWMYSKDVAEIQTVSPPARQFSTGIVSNGNSFYDLKWPDPEFKVAVCLARNCI